jgi:hypothetical protein
VIAQVLLFGGPDDGAEYTVEASELPTVIRVPHQSVVEVAAQDGVSLREQRPIGVACYVRYEHLPEIHPRPLPSGAYAFGWGGWE